MESTSQGGRRLADLCTDLLALTVQVRAGGDPGGGEEVRRQVDRGIYRLELEARDTGLPNDWVESAKYALCAFLDESILKRLDEIWPGPGGEAPEAYAW